MDGFTRPPRRPENIDPSSQEKDQDTEITQANEVLVDTETDAEADEAVVAGVAAIGGLALKWHHVKQFFVRWWRNKKQRYWTLGSVLAVLIVLFIVPLTRFGILNAIGFRASANISVLDGETGLPLKSALVKVGPTQAETDDSGQATLEKVRLGDQEIQVSKPGYGDELWGQRINIGSNDLGQRRMTATGTRFTFRLLDWHGSQPLEKVLAEVNGASAFSDENGLLKLVTPPSDEQLEITFSAEGYNELTFMADPANFEEQEVKMVLAGHNAFITKRGGQFDVYRSQLDGSQAELMVEATGRERESALALSVDPSGKFAALVSTRDGQRNDDGFILSGLYIINLETSEMTRLELSESIELTGWHDDRLLYTTQTSGESGNSPTRFKLRSFKLGNLTSETLEASNYFYGVILANGRVYYAPAESIKQSQPPEHFMSMLPDGSDRRTHVPNRTVRVARTDFDTLVLETLSSNFKQTWYSFSLGQQSAVKLDGQPASFEYWSSNADFVSSPDGKWLAWQEERDGRDVIILRESGGAERILANLDGAQAPVRWVNNQLVIFRVVKSGESADYALSVATDAKPVKLADVTDVPAH